MFARLSFKRELTRFSCLPIVVLCLTAPSRVEAQSTINQNPGNNVSNRNPLNNFPLWLPWAAYDPVLAMTTRVFEQADLIRTQEESEAEFAQDEKRLAEARKQGVDDWDQAVRQEWDMKIVKEQKRLQLNHARQIAKLTYLNDQKWKSSRIWEKYKNHPELSSYNIRTGKAHHFLLARLASSVLEYEFDENESRFSPETLGDLTLDDELLSHITLAQNGYEFPANQNVRDEIEQWPYLLRWEDFHRERSAFENARKEAIRESESKGEVSVKSVEKLQDAQMQLVKTFYFSSRVGDWVKKHRRYAQREETLRFLAQLDREIKRLQETGDIRPFQGRSGYDPAVDGKHVVALLTFMNRNGIDFAPAKPGSEFAYYRLFVMMRAVYLTVAEEDEAIRPEDLSKRIEVD